MFREPCYFAEAVYLLYYFVNHVSYAEDYRRVVQAYRPHFIGQEDQTEARIRELMRISAEVTADLNPENEALRHYFEKLGGTDRKNGCCLAQVMLMTVPLDKSDIDDFAEQLLTGYRYMREEGIKINDLNAMGLVMERWDAQEEPESLAAQLERLPCSIEAKWEILRALTDFEDHLRELTALIRPVAERLHSAMKNLEAMNEETLCQWCTYFQTHTVDDFQNEMFNTTFLFTEENQPHEIWLGLWNFNPLGTWSEWMEAAENKVRVAYIGMSISFDFAVRRKERPDEEALCTMLRALGGKDKLEILRRCAERPNSAAKLATAMNLNSGTVSRNLYGLFKLGYLETRGDGERVNYVTRLDTMEQLFRWVIEYVSSPE